MSTLSALSQITAAEVTYTPSVITAVQAVEALVPNASGAEKSSAAIGAVAQSLSTSGNPNVAAIAQQVNLVVAVCNLLGLFRHKPAPALAPVKTIG